MNRIIVTPAGRKKFLSILLMNLLKKRSQFDKWILWANTNKPEDLEYINKIANKYDFIEKIDLEVQFDGNFSISSFFRHCVDENSAYLRLDDDICFIDEYAIDKIFEYRINNQEPFLILGNIINNSIVNFIHRQNNRYPEEIGDIKYKALDYIDRDLKHVAVNIHNFVIDKIKNNRIKDLMFDETIDLKNYERFSVNAVCWLGKDFAKFDGIPDFSGQSNNDEEEFLTVTMPSRLGRPNRIYGNSIFVHFSFSPHLGHIMNHHPDIYKFYFKEQTK